MKLEEEYYQESHPFIKTYTKVKESLKDRKGKDEDIVKCLKKHDEEQHPTGEGLPEKQRLYRIKVVSAFL